MLIKVVKKFFQMKFSYKVFYREYLVVIVIGNGHGDQTSNPGRSCLHFPLR